MLVFTLSVFCLLCPRSNSFLSLSVCDVVLVRFLSCVLFLPPLHFLSSATNFSYFQGGLSGAIEISITFPTEYVKTQLHLQHENSSHAAGNRFNGPWHVVKATVHVKQITFIHCSHVVGAWCGWALSWNCSVAVFLNTESSLPLLGL